MQQPLADPERGFSAVSLASSGFYGQNLILFGKH
jgi:hypothetical protein